MNAQHNITSTQYNKVTIIIINITILITLQPIPLAPIPNIPLGSLGAVGTLVQLSFLDLIG